MDSGEGGKDWHWCNLFIKYLLFLINTIIWVS